MTKTGDEISRILGDIEHTPQLRAQLLHLLTSTLDLRANRFHPLVFVHGEPVIGEGVYVGLFSEINAKGGRVEIGRNCDIASFVSINVADSHRKTLGLADDIERGEIVLGESVFVGSHAFIGGVTAIGHHSAVAAGTILVNGGVIPPYSLVVGNPAVVKPGYFTSEAK